KRLQFPQVTIQYGDPLCWERVASPTAAQQQAVADEVAGTIRELYRGLEQRGRKAVIRAVREERRAAASRAHGALA
ncbi:MAG: hypothetical protein KGJ43_10220, partial [Acidobacteriota bacterium]|nr:hypothetical protein [Acidobacteriota bacterium]